MDRKEELSMTIKERIENYKDEMLKNLADLVSYDSKEDLSDPAYPFGKTNADCLNRALEICESYGFKTKNLDNYCGYAEIGEGDQVIGVLAHLDIVPAGEGWVTDPFKMVIEGDHAIGRGTSDDKGPACASMIAMKILKDMDVPLNKRVRLIFGLNEETGSKCLAHYVAKEGHMDMGFTPDGAFPGVHGEKGLMGAHYESTSDKILSINGGVAKNVVCARCATEFVLDDIHVEALLDYFKQNNIEAEFTCEGNIGKLDVKGKAAHGGGPANGVNAAAHTLKALEVAGMKDKFVDFYNKHIGFHFAGEGLGCFLEDQYGATTCCNGMIKTENGLISGTLDIRFPVTFKGNDVVSLIEKTPMENGKVVIDTVTEPLYFPLESPLVTKLWKAYQKVTGDMETKPFTMGGGTYAKGIHNCIAFGGGFPNRENTHAHDCNEFTSISALLKQTEVYIEAIQSLLED